MQVEPPPHAPFAHSSTSVVQVAPVQPKVQEQPPATHVPPFEQVTAAFAAIEGEGDGSLEYWRRAHWAYFGRECARVGREPSLAMPVACERFQVIYRTNA